VVIHGGRVLVHRGEKDDFWTLPGGRVEFGESAAAALERELHEELGIETKVERLLWLVENFFFYNQVEFHELGFYFLVRTPPDWARLDDDAPFYSLEDNNLIIFWWRPLAALHELRLYPSFLAPGLVNLPEHIVHLVHRDVDK
jgi:ADP-ribose pyrophosphatase YjhB (NUDIX family)